MRNTKLNKLKNILKRMDGVLVAYSGGTDSSFLTKIANEMLGEKALAVIAKSETYPENEYRQAVRFVRKYKIRFMTVDTEELSDRRFASNPPERCYYCKKELFLKLNKLAETKNLRYVVDGTNADDTADFRPGRKAALEYGVRSPLHEAGLTKNEIRMLSRKMGLTTWSKPSQACLASRFPYGTPIEKKNMGMVEKAECIFHKMGISQIRVRHHGDMARIEAVPSDYQKLISVSVRKKVIQKMRDIGYQYIALDLEGYRSGSMNEVLKKK